MPRIEGSICDQSRFAALINADPDEIGLLFSTAEGENIVANGLERRAREVNFPEPTATAMRVLRLLPNWLFDALVGAGAKRMMADK